MSNEAAALWKERGVSDWGRVGRLEAAREPEDHQSQKTVPSAEATSRRFSGGELSRHLEPSKLLADPYSCERLQRDIPRIMSLHDQVLLKLTGRADAHRTRVGILPSQVLCASIHWSQSLKSATGAIVTQYKHICQYPQFLYFLILKSNRTINHLSNFSNSPKSQENFL